MNSDLGKPGNLSVEIYGGCFALSAQWGCSGYGEDDTYSLLLRKLILGASSGPPLIRPNHFPTSLSLNPVLAVLRICQNRNPNSWSKNPLNKLRSQNCP